MYKNKKILVLIPARGGSKRLPGKNIKQLNGKPLIAYTIEAALRSKFIDKIVLSTDSEKIRSIALKMGIEVPFLRPRRLSSDSATSYSALMHAINFYKKIYNQSYDIIVMLQPTSPLRSSMDIDQAVELLFTKSAKAVVSVCESNYPACWLNTLPKNGSMKSFLKPKFNKPRQKLPQYFRLNGAIYIAYSDYLINQKGFFGPETFAYVMPQERSVDIDTEFDFKIAEFILRS